MLNCMQHKGLGGHMLKRTPLNNTGLHLCAFKHPQKALALKRSLKAQASVSSLIAQLQTVPFYPTVYYAGGAALVAFAGIIAAASNMSSQSADEVKLSEKEVEAAQAAPLPAREKAVLVVGATGRVGRRIVKQLLARGRCVVAVMRSREKAEEVLLKEMGFTEGLQPSGSGVLFIEPVDITNAESVAKSNIWEGVTQVVLSAGGITGRRADGSFGYLNELSSEKVEGEALPALVSLLASKLPTVKKTLAPVLSMSEPNSLAVWDRLDDVIMGGSSGSKMEAYMEGEVVKGAKWSGELIVEGGGFCGTRTKDLGLDLSAYDGIHMRVRGDGQTFKMNIKTSDQLDMPESTYQTTFDTVAGQWQDVYLPWHNFVPVKRAISDPEGEPLDASKIRKLGLVLSRFEFNKAPNPNYRPGPFELLIEGGINGYSDVRPQIVMVASAGVERNAIIGDNFEKRMKDIPIVQLNPGGTLNYKYIAEMAVRSSGLAYTVVRSTGMEDNLKEGEPLTCLLDADQGDRMIGGITRNEVAAAIAAMLDAPESVGKTFEIRRNLGAESRGKEMEKKDYTRMLLKLALDRHRWQVGLQPFPMAVPPPPPPAPETVQKILADPRVQTTVERREYAEKKAAEKKTAEESNGSAETEKESVPEPELARAR